MATPVYTDVSLRFVVHPVSGDVAKLTDADAVAKSIKHLLLTGLFERPFEPGIGSRLSQLLFEPMDTVTERLIVDEIKLMVEQFEPRVRLTAVQMTAIPDEYSFQATLEYTILNVPHVQRQTLTLARIR